MQPELDPSQRIVVTGMGCVSPLGKDVESSWENLIDGRHAIKDIREEVLRNFPRIRAHMAAMVEDFNLLDDTEISRVVDRGDMPYLHRSAQFALWAGAQALRQAGLITGNYPDSRYLIDTSIVNPRRIGVSIGTGIGGAEVLGPARLHLEAQSRSNPKLTTIFNALPERVATEPSMNFGLKGPPGTVIGACATANMNFINAAAKIRLGDADFMLAGGTEAQISPEGMVLFDRITALDLSDDPETASRPFHQRGAGFVMGEGGGMLVLESYERACKRGATVLAELVGYGESLDANHRTKPDPNEQANAMQIAMDKTGYDRNYRMFVNAHATGTKSDGGELIALSQVVKPEDVVGISSYKGATGHLLGASGAFEAIMDIMALRTGIIPPTLKLNEMVPEAEGWSMVALEAMHVGPIDLVMNNSFGFGGINAVTIFGKVEE